MSEGLTGKAKKYDVVVVGAGPAGGQCARSLSAQGFHVLLLDRAKHFQENNYSSGGAPIELMAQFNLPDSIVGTFWNILRVQSTHSKVVWKSDTPFGPVVDFDKLREFLAEETRKQGGEYLLGCQYHSHEIDAQTVKVNLKNLASSSIFSVEALVIVDATGSERKVLLKQAYDKKQAIAAAGIEYHIEVDEESYRQYAQALNFFLGHQWMPQGYSWIFPMTPRLLKVGVIRYFQNQRHVDHDPSYVPYLERLLRTCGNYTVKSKHGKMIYYTPRQRDVRHRGPIIAVGDAISSVNPLGWEGMRHAMVSGELAAKTIVGYLKKKNSDLSAYDRDLNRYFGQKWFFSEKIMNLLFKAEYDSTIDRSVRSLKSVGNWEMMQVIFHYRFRYVLKSYAGYLWSKLFHTDSS